MVQRMMDRYDVNKDAKIDASEMNELDDRARGMVTRADSNSDGEITKDEIEQSMQQMTRGGGSGGPRGGANDGGNP
jgi:Ca2+-binding EF-hand superfamily protein